MLRGAPPSPLFLSACHDHPIENKREELVWVHTVLATPVASPPSPTPPRLHPQLMSFLFPYLPIVDI
ncbi:hypothetical protein J6590_006341 [Homalodisca vitripennis]|nr:hypothetical protein J6590_006341 [Homalodisca vitripennis]